MKSHRYKLPDKLYDLTEFVNIHPGGTDMFQNLKPDTDITPMLYMYHKDPKAIIKTVLPNYEIPLTTDTLIEYPTNYTYESYCELKKLVYDEIRLAKIPLVWSNQEIAYNAGMLALYFGLWAYCFWNATGLSHGWIGLLACMNMGYAALVFHELSHHAGFKNQKLNAMLSYLVMSPLITTEDWKYEHNYLHHSFTNTEYDGDYEKGKLFIRHSNTQAHHFQHRFQFLYAYMIFLFVGFMKGPLNALMKRRWNILLFLAILYNFSYIHTFMIYGITGLLFSAIAQVSHIQHECIQTHRENKNDFLYNQVTSSMNYRTDDPLTRLVCFGLDIQIEHHLFPNIPHSSLRKIQPVVRAYCDKNKIPYIEKSSIFPMIYSYFSYLYKMGLHTEKELHSLQEATEGGVVRPNVSDRDNDGRKEGH
jgi:linoleoyl-CoA desaturase